MSSPYDIVPHSAPSAPPDATLPPQRGPLHDTVETHARKAYTNAAKEAKRMKEWLQDIEAGEWTPSAELWNKLKNECEQAQAAAEGARSRYEGIRKSGLRTSAEVRGGK